MSGAHSFASMKTTIYYFSATGNSLALARDLARELGNADILSIADLQNEKEISPSAQVIGLIYPVYAFGIPLIVERFISRMRFRSNQYLFTVTNYAMIQGAGLTKARRLLKKRGLAPKAEFGVVMPNNYIPFGGAASAAQQKILFDAAQEKIKGIADVIRRQASIPAQTGFFLWRWLFAEPVCLMSAGMMNNEDKNFHLNEKCDGCGICQKVCCVKNIVIKDKTPFWQHHCELCMACFHWCPREAIEFGRATKGKKRYHHPAAKLQDFLAR
ncbi:MAG TPA: EFR1 family ferrodoxin [Candidatus Omnitrophota bacterium]|nr:EFR1 family ferrodoxin [Candidatus Omnitrophota bacterium]HQL41675.1 EFR1 family ferrodoxin [Candidatus Omnitrophota bacterium]